MGSMMMPGKYDCAARALPDEPTFTLLARDPQAPSLVREWAYRRAHDIAAGARPPEDVVMVTEAIELADQMEKWRAANDGKWRPKLPIQEGS